MINILKEGKIENFKPELIKYKDKCDNCGCIFEFQEEDVKALPDHYYFKEVYAANCPETQYIICPFCNSDIYYRNYSYMQLRV